MVVVEGPLFVVSPSKLGQYFNLGQCNRLLHQSTERGGGVADMEDLPSDFRQATIDGPKLARLKDDELRDLGEPIGAPRP